ncbi:MAG: DUF4037 domain-containing protein [Candidatus Heimdallarchaeota archaeon]|nr:DUF4037 domain-containing protein [Candidatus Heimdallarchaeota archaeon]
MDNRSNVNIPQTIDEIEEERVRNYLLDLVQTGHVLGILLQGSQVTGFNTDPKRDWDFFIYVTQEYFSTLDVEDVHTMDIEEKDGIKHLVGDYAFASDQVFEDQLSSPMDIDHIAYVNSVTIYDPTGKLEKWRVKLAEFPDSMYEPRLRAQATQLGIAAGYYNINNYRGFELDTRINYFRAITIATSYWFSLHKSWTPQHKWWSRHARRLGMLDFTYSLFDSAINDISKENLMSLIKHLFDLTKEKGVFLDPKRDFLMTLLPEGRATYIRHSYF